MLLFSDDTIRVALDHSARNPKCWLNGHINFFALSTSERLVELLKSFLALCFRSYSSAFL